VPGHEIIVLGASAGGIEALTRIACGLPPELPAAIFVVVHMPVDAPSHLPGILARRSPLRVSHAHDRAPIRLGRLYVAPPNRHLVLEWGQMRLTYGPRVNGVRPAIDPLFYSAARAYGPAVIGVLLSGALDDGVAGLAAIKRRGGLAVIQDPADALVPSIPLSACERVPIDYCRPAAELGPLLATLVHAPLSSNGGKLLAEENEQTRTGELSEPGSTSQDQKRSGRASGLTCPECHGSLWEVHDGEQLRYVCRVDHAFSVDTLLFEQAEAVEAAVWAAVNALQERAALMRRLSAQVADRDPGRAAHFREQAEQAEQQADVIHQVLMAAVRAQSTQPE